MKQHSVLTKYKLSIVNCQLSIILLMVAFFASPLKAQVEIGNQTAPQKFSLLELTTEKIKAGLRLPQLTTDQRNALVANPNDVAKGLTIYNTDTNCVDFWNGTEWISLCSDVITSPAANGINLTTAGLDNQTECLGSAISNIIYSTTGATGATVTGLPGGVTGAWASDAVTISGTPTETGTFNYTVALTGGSGTGTATGTITVNTIPNTPVISGQSSAISGSTGLVYSVSNPVAGATYTWTVTGAGWTPASGTGTSITLTPGTETGTINVVAANGSCTSTAASMNVSIITIPTTLGSGSLTGRICFDIAETEGGTECGTLASRLPNQANFADPATSTQTYTFTALSSPVNNVRFVIQDPEGALLASDPISGTLSASLANGSSVTLTVHFKTNLNSPSATPLIVGRSRTGADKVIINIVYNNGSQDVYVPLTANIQDCACCGAMTTSGTWLQFMCHNLGADQSLDPFTYVAGNADGSGGTLGYLFQWGRPADGHQLRTSGTTATLSGSGTPGNALFIRASSDWTASQNDKLWNSGTEAAPAKTTNDPCPSGYRVPTKTEWSSIFVGGSTFSAAASSATANTWTWTTTNGGGYKIGSALYLPAAGYRSYSAGALQIVGTTGFYWSSTPDDTDAYNLEFSSSTVVQQSYSDRADGLSVRCVRQ